MRWDCAQFARKVLVGMDMVFLLAVILCTWIVGFCMRRMSKAGNLTDSRSALFVKLGFRGLFASVCDGLEPHFRFKWYDVVLRKGL